ncbi:MAG: fructose-6-phosphate aldolase [Acidaminococcales bacterium]|nr:fructose-6-phosphate aldolase [Acidaminococcales bacterium]
MDLFLDTANIGEIREATSLGVIAGVTTNPSLVAKEGRAMAAVIREITAINPGPVSAEVLSSDAAGMVAEGRELSRIADNVAVKIPMTAEGLKAASQLAKDGVKTNLTLIFSVNQALLAAKAGASYVSPFVGRLDDIDHDGIGLVGEIARLFALHSLPARIIAASVRHPLHVSQAALAGAHIATIPYKVLMDMIGHPLTRSGIEKFTADWERAKK